LDDDPYTDLFWGILTSYDAAGALRIAQHAEPLVVNKAASGTEIELEKCREGLWYCELNQHHMVRKTADGEPEVEKAPADTTKSLVDSLNDYHADLFVTSGHATERDWQIGFRYRNGSFRCRDGVLYGLDTEGNEHIVNSPNPKVYMPIGNCLMGHIKDRQSMALAFMNSAGVHQMIGYTVPTWYGYGGWGCLDYFVEQPGRYTFAEAFFANHAALVHRIDKYVALSERAGKTTARLTDAAAQAKFSAQDARGHLFDRDVVAFYGDPAWQARMADGPKSWEQSLSEQDGVYTFRIKPNLGTATFEPVNTNGAQRGYRPIVQFFPQRLEGFELLEGEDLLPELVDNFLLIPNPRTCDPDREYKVVFRANPITQSR
jgi:zinc protease